MSPITPGETFKALMELPGHFYVASARAMDALGIQGVECVVADLGFLLLKAEAFNDQWVSVTFWQHDKGRMQAITRCWPSDDQRHHTEVSLVEECCGGYAVVLAQTILEQVPVGDKQMGLGKIRPANPQASTVIFHGPYEVVLIPAQLVCAEEAENKRQG